MGIVFATGRCFFRQYSTSTAPASTPTTAPAATPTTTHTTGTVSELPGGGDGAAPASTMASPLAVDTVATAAQLPVSDAATAGGTAAATESMMLAAAEASVKAAATSAAVLFVDKPTIRKDTSTGAGLAVKLRPCSRRRRVTATSSTAITTT